MTKKNELSGQLILSDGEEEAKLPAIPMPVLEALFATVTGAKDWIDAYRRKAAQIEISNIEQLCFILEQWAEPYSPVAKKLSLSSFRKRMII